MDITELPEIDDLEPLKSDDEFKEYLTEDDVKPNQVCRCASGHYCLIVSLNGAFRICQDPTGYLYVSHPIPKYGLLWYDLAHQDFVVSPLLRVVEIMNITPDKFFSTCKLGL